MSRLGQGAEELTDDRMTSLVHFLRFLNGHPNGDDAARCTVMQPCFAFRATGARIDVLGAPGILQLLGFHGYPADLVTRYAALPIDLPLPSIEALRQVRVITLPVKELGVRYPLLGAGDGSSHFDDVLDPDDHLICHPILDRGASIGVLTITYRNNVEWDQSNLLFLEAITNALGLWLSTGSGPPLPALGGGANGIGTEIITKRQRLVLGLLAAGESNKQIGKSLGYSEATIKKDVQSLLSVIQSRDRVHLVERAQRIGLLP